MTTITRDNLFWFFVVFKYLFIATMKMKKQWNPPYNNKLYRTDSTLSVCWLIIVTKYNRRNGNPISAYFLIKNKLFYIFYQFPDEWLNLMRKWKNVIRNVFEDNDLDCIWLIIMSMCRKQSIRLLIRLVLPHLFQ